jgi:uncharacterized protein (DUF433 family)
MDWRDHIEQRPGVLGGKPVIKGTRISVELLLEKTANGYSEADLIKAYPFLKPEEIRAAFVFASDMVSTLKKAG